MAVRILLENEHFFAIDKAKGDFVHPPEIAPYPVPPERICLYRLRERYRRPVYPVHRLDAPTSGVVLFGFTKEATRRLSSLFKEREIEKTYHAVARGFVESEGLIDLPLESKDGPLESVTAYRRLAEIEIDEAVGTRYPTARYSLVEVRPRTGRWHQIRRHFDRIAHPLLGDIEHGDSHHNRFFRDRLGIGGLCLRAVSLEFADPWSGERMRIEAPACETWKKIDALFERGGA